MFGLANNTPDAMGRFGQAMPREADPMEGLGADVAHGPGQPMNDVLAMRRVNNAIRAQRDALAKQVAALKQKLKDNGIDA